MAPQMHTDGNEEAACEIGYVIYYPPMVRRRMKDRGRVLVCLFFPKQVNPRCFCFIEDSLLPPIFLFHFLLFQRRCAWSHVLKVRPCRTVLFFFLFPESEVSDFFETVLKIFLPLFLNFIYPSLPQPPRSRNFSKASFFSFHCLRFSLSALCPLCYKHENYWPLEKAPKPETLESIHEHRMGGRKTSDQKVFVGIKV